MRRHRSSDQPAEIQSPQVESASAEVADAAREVYKDEDRTLALTALGLLGLAVTAGGIAAARHHHHIKKHKE